MFLFSSPTPHSLPQILTCFLGHKKAEDVKLFTELKVGREGSDKAEAIFRCHPFFRNIVPWLDCAVYARSVLPDEVQASRKRARGGEGQDGGGGGGTAVPTTMRFLGQIRAMFKGPAPQEKVRLLMMPYAGDPDDRRQFPHEVLAWHSMTCEGQSLIVVDAVSEHSDTAFVFPALNAAGETWEVGQEDAREDYLEAYKNVFWLPRDLYFPVHEYPSERADEDGED